MTPMRIRLSTPADRLRRLAVRQAEGLFSHAEDPLAHTLRYAGDPGLFGPDSVTWELMGDVSTFVGGIRALLVQAAHPEVVAGVADHSRYREDPLGRLSRTSNYVTATSYGAMEEVEAAVRAVRRAHVGVRGTSHRGVPYTAGNPPLAAWVHNSLTDSFLVSAQVFGPRALSTEEADRFVLEQAAVGRLLGADPLPETATDLARWVAQHPAVGPSPGMLEAVRFLEHPPLDVGVLQSYRLLASAAVATLPERICDALGVRARRGAVPVGRTAIRSLRWVLGSSPRWRLALLRAGAPIPEHRFKQKMPFETIGGPQRRMERDVREQDA
jgi:uncharacterized protein (DUF2236 family)